MKQLKNKQLSAIMGTSLPTTRRFTNHFVGGDPRAPLQGGKSRFVSLNKGFKIFIGARLVAEMRYTMDEAKTIIDNLYPWLEQKGLLPVSEYRAKGSEKFYEILIFCGIVSGTFHLIAKGLIGRKEQKPIDGVKTIDERHSLEDITLDNSGAWLAHDDSHCSILNLRRLLQVFNDRIEWESLGDYQ